MGWTGVGDEILRWSGVLMMINSDVCARMRMCMFNVHDEGMMVVID